MKTEKIKQCWNKGKLDRRLNKLTKERKEKLTKKWWQVWR